MSDDLLKGAAVEERPQTVFAYEYVRWQLDDQADRARSIYARVAVVVSLNSIIVGVFAIAAAIVVQEWVLHLELLAYHALGFFLASTGCAFRVLELKQWVQGPPPRDVSEIAGDLGENSARGWTTQQLTLTYERNEATISRMEIWTRAAVIFAFLVAAFAVVLLLAAMQG